MAWDQLELRTEVLALFEDEAKPRLDRRSRGVMFRRHGLYLRRPGTPSSGPPSTRLGARHAPIVELTRVVACDCGASFTSSFANARYCSAACSIRIQLARDAGARAEKRARKLAG